jgi:carboxylesterase type B
MLAFDMHTTWIAILLLGGHASSQVVQTVYGTISGSKCQKTNAFSYLGIPYAEPPVGDLRFMPTQPYAGKYLDQTLNAIVEPKICIQFSRGYRNVAGESEDWYV